MSKLTLTVGENTRTLREWSLETGVSVNTMHMRRHMGWSDAEVVGLAQRQRPAHAAANKISVEVDGRQTTFAELAERHKVSMPTVYSRYRAGWDMASMTSPRRYVPKLCNHPKPPWTGVSAAATAMRRCRIRTPPWAELWAITEFYRACPPGMVVDHIVPLKGEGVSGLHVLSNLQYLSVTTNAIKGNSFDPG